MTIHDELVREFVKLNKNGKPIGQYILNLAGSSHIECKLEETYSMPDPYNPRAQAKGDYVRMTPDIVVTNLENDVTTAIEIENDIQWDFGKSLRQIKMYRKNTSNFQNVVIIIPKKYERFARYYKSEGFEVWLWEATRLWQCMKCDTKIPSKKTGKPKCTKPKCNSTELALIGLEGHQFTLFKEE